MAYQPVVSVIIPTYNEEEDIRRTMDALCAQDYDALEIVVVDASHDRTPEIIRGYGDRLPHLRIIPQGAKEGVSAARNIGLSEATGEIAVILNADVFPEGDFISRVVAHYADGVDYVVVDSRVANVEALYPRYLQAVHEFEQDRLPDPADWSEGFSCRREAALSVGGFPEEFAHNTAGEDGIFSERLRSKFHGVRDLSIVVPHIAPDTYHVYWRQRLGRGRGGAYRLYAFEGRPLKWGAVLRSVAGTLFLTLSLIAPLVRARQLAHYSPRRMRDWLNFTWARMVEMAATAWGYWQGCREIARRGPANTSG